MTTQPSAPSVVWAVYALRFSRVRKTRSDALLLCPPDRSTEPLDMDYSCWLLVAGDQHVLVDTGYSPALGARRGREFLADPVDLVRRLGVAPEAIEDVVLTHLHYDHAGNIDRFPRATFHLHERELEPASGWHAQEPSIAFAYEAEHVAALQQANAEGRVRLVAQGSELRDGIDLVHLPGHTPGHLGVRVRTRRGALMLTGDAVHVAANLAERRPFPLYSDLRQTFVDYDRILQMCQDPTLLVPGHEASVIERFPAAGPGLEGLIGCLHEDPLW